jgi:UDP-N-acetylmuramate dehydrogenase
MYSDFIEEISKFNLEIKQNEPLAPYTTWHIGGPAEIFAITHTASNLSKLVKTAIKYRVPYTILGGGSNVLISDNGIKGLVIVNKSREIEIVDNQGTSKDITANEAESFNPWIQPRHGEEDDSFYSFKDLDYEESGKRIKVKVSSGVDLAWATAWTLKNGITGLQFFAGIPGTIGGALFNNIHGGTKHFSDYFDSAKVLVDGVEKEYKFEDFNFGYDQSVLREHKNIVVVEVVLNLFYGDVEKAKFVANEWMKRKRRQPRRTAGCTFKNIPLDKQKELDFPTPSVGYIVDKLFGWTGKSSGEAEISTNHANFIENKGNASSKDVINLINQVKTRAKQDYNLELETEINLVGFEKNIID